MAARFQLVASKPVLRTPIFDVTHDRAEGPRGAAIDRKIVRHPGAAVMMARDEQGKVLLIRQFRLPPRRYLWELPAGRLDEGETPLQAAKRELAEETGYRARSWSKLFDFYPSPGFCDERMTAFVAEGLRAGEASPEPYELIEKKWFQWEDALAMVGSKCIKDSKTIATLLYFDRFAKAHRRGGRREP